MLFYGQKHDAAIAQVSSERYKAMNPTSYIITTHQLGSKILAKSIEEVARQLDIVCADHAHLVRNLWGR